MAPRKVAAKKAAAAKKRIVSDLDGIERLEETEMRLNGAMAMAFTGPNGELALDYLKSITIQRVNGPEVSSDALRHMEGMRNIVAIIQQRIQRGRKGE